jgi:hypothetical protein
MGPYNPIDIDEARCLYAASHRRMAKIYKKIREAATEGKDYIYISSLNESDDLDNVMLNLQELGFKCEESNYGCTLRVMW